MNHITEDILMHYGMPRRSGRYPYGSGEDPYQHSRDFLGRLEELKRQGWTETPENIEKEFGMNTTDFRNEKALCNAERKMYNVTTAKRLATKEGLGPTEIGRQMGVRESTVREWLKGDAEHNANKAFETANFLKEQVDSRGMIEIGSGAELELNISKEKLGQALTLLKRDGYEVYSGRIEQPTNKGQSTTQKVLCPPGTPHSEIYKLDKVHSLKEYISRDNGETFEKKFTYPESMDSKRLKIRYNEEGGLEKDGIVELRRGVDDLSLGGSRYSQVRILVDGTHYIKGMAVYSDDMPKGVDVIFNTNKKKGTDMKDVLKEIKKDPDNPFGSAIKDVEQGGQYWYTDKKTGERKLGLINKRADEGDWSEWKDALPSQFLGKQSKYMAEKQLKLAKEDKQAEYEAICELTNPTIKKHFLQKFSDSCDSAAVHLQAAALPRQKYHVIIPVNSLKDNEIYAPGYSNGEKLALIRYPHGGTFEIPVLTVNNKHAPAKKLLGTDVMDAVGINSKNAEKLSGADFDGDTVMCIPTDDAQGRVKIARKPSLEGLEGFDPKTQYSAHEIKVDADGTKHYYQNGNEYRIMKNTGTQMGVISNLITDMTLAKANEEELAAAVRHSMVVIDAEKHKLNYKQSAIDNNIPALHKKYQGKTTGGAATILSRAKGETSVPKRQGNPKINIKGEPWYDPTKPEGSYIYKTAKDLEYQVSKVNKRTGEITTVTKQKQQQSTKMLETDDAMTLVSDGRHPMELVYADYANSMKALANKARVEMVSTGKIAYDAGAAKTYQGEVKSLDEKLRVAELNKPKEREAIRRANVDIENKKAQYKETHGVEMKGDDLKKIKQQAMTKHRKEVGALSRRERNINISDREWEAIQSGAITENKLRRILNNTDVDELRERAMPRATTQLSKSQVSRVKSLQASGYTLDEIAKKMGKSTSTISNYLKGGN